MPRQLTQHDLEAYLDEGLPIEAMARVEGLLRGDPSLARQLISIDSRRDAGVHSLGEIWRRHRLSCPTRDQLGSYLMGVMDEDQAGYVQFHLEVSGCRTCLANLDDLKSRQTEKPATVETRRRKYFQSSAGQLRTK